MKEYDYELTFKVRDYECDLQGIVNNANYQHYLEHTRHEFLLSRGISFSELHEKGIDAVIARIEIAFKYPLRSKDEFVSKLNIRKEGIKNVFYQDIYRLPDMKLCIRAKAENVCLVQGELKECPELEEKLNVFYAPQLSK
ncbi:MAG TPA: acyl-CoA thioesterase [Paludibacteraceae bacterium]|nr:acyl-CoA thioesterase [Paludibacteraceae bacterium]HPL95025.1 acyl-CoA thioesterase [Paludibacteraceae bacterium]